MRATYGIDAPGLVRGFLLAGAGAGAAGGATLAWAAAKSWALWLAGLLFIVSVYALGMCGYMLYGSLVAKVRGREALLDLIAWTGRERVLDVGCGRGLLVVGAAHRLAAGHATGVDLWLERDQSANLRTAVIENARLEGVADRVSVETADMRDLPFAAASFDVVLSSWAVHNLEAAGDRARALAEMARVLRPGGSILLNDIVNRNEYAAEFKRLGFGNVRIVVDSAWRDRMRGLVSFGAFRPATVVAERPLADS